jgi:hypothetical protein
LTKVQLKKISNLKKSLDHVEKRLISIAIEISTTTNTSNYYWAKLSSESRKAYEEARILFANWSKYNIPLEYNYAIKDQIKRIKNLSFVPRNLAGNNIAINYVKFINSNKNIQYKASVMKDAIMYFSSGLEDGQKRLNRLMNMTQQILIKEDQVRKLLSTGLKEKGTIKSAQKKLQEKLLKKSLDGKFITVINKNGKPMEFGVKTYSEMVARTEIINAESQAVLTTALEYETDLVQVSSHNTTAEICQQYEGKIFSISGKDKDFPILDAAPAYHPNCGHTLSIIFREVLERRGIQKYIDFSTGKTEIHPTRKSHIPVSKRKRST